MEDEGVGAVEVAAARAQAPDRPLELGVDVLGDDLAVGAPAPEDALPGQGLSRDGVAGGGGRDELVHPHQAASRSVTAARRSHTAGHPYSSRVYARPRAPMRSRSPGSSSSRPAAARNSS